jgi:hypothetical protein
MLSRGKAIVCALAVAGTLTLPSAAAAQEPPAGPSRVVVSNRDVRMNLAGVVALRVGCYGRGGDVCIGRLEARLSEPILARRSRARNSGYRIYGPFLLGRQGFSVPSTRGKVVRLQFFPRAGYLVRLAGSIPVTVTARFASRGRTGLRTEQEINVYVSPLQTYR